MGRLTVLLMVIYCLIYSFSYAEKEEVTFFQEPDIENGFITFVYNSDIYVVPEDGGFARRLTSHIGQENFPKFSPGGKEIAFTGQYLGEYNVFSMSTDGGEPNQLTYYPESDRVIDWTPDGKNILFTSRQNSFVRFFNKFFIISPDKKGLPEELPIDKGSLASYSPDGKQLLFNRHSDRFWWWKRYKGSANLDLWLYDFTQKSFTKLTEYEGNDIWPMWGYDGYYFVSDRDGIANIYKMNRQTKEITKITNMENDGVSWPSIDSKGEKIVFLNDGKIYKLDLKTKQVSDVAIELQADPHLDMVEFITPKHASSMTHISPSAKRVVTTIRGEIVSLPAEEGIVRNYTNSSGARDYLPLWSPDGKHIAYISDKDGEQEIFIVDQMAHEKPKKLTDNGNFKIAMDWAPDSKKILYGTNDRKIYFVDIYSKKSVLIDSSLVDLISDASWSPDSRWITFVKYLKNYSTQIFVYDCQNNKLHNLGLDQDVYSNPRFTPDGKGLVFFHSPLYRTSFQSAYYLALRDSQEPFIKLENDEEKGKTEKDKKDKKKDDDKDKKDKKKDVKVTIDFQGIDQRLELIKKMRGRMDYLQLTDKYYYFMKLDAGSWHSFFRKISLYYYDVENEKVEKAFDGMDNYAIAANQKKLVVCDNGKLKIMKVGVKSSGSSKKLSALERKKQFVSLDGIKIKLDHREEWTQIFREAHNMVKYNFYDPNFHGMNWDSIGNYYKKFLPAISTREELNILIEKMVGELNASHQGASGGDQYGDSYKKPRYTLGLLGAKFQLDEKANRYQISKIYKEKPASLRTQSPLSKYFQKIKEGDYLIAINGQEITGDDNPYYHLLLNGTKARITLTYNSKPRKDGAKEVYVDPVYHEITLRYQEWVDDNEEYVSEQSKGDIGYIHLKDMSSGGLRQFKQKIKEYQYKQGIIIDVRYNGGGSIDPKLIDYLEKEKYMSVRERYGYVSERPYDGFFGKMVVLCNEYSYSDAEVFPRAFQIRKLGKVIGVPTLGFVIAVTGHRMIDGGNVRKTFIGLWDNKGDMMESIGVQPDIVVHNTPEEELKGIDKQLDKAIEHLKEEIKKDPRDFDYPVPIDPR